MTGAQKRSQPDEGGDSSSKTKAARLDSTPTHKPHGVSSHDSTSSAAKQKKNNSSNTASQGTPTAAQASAAAQRTGQACDRCRSRKIRCDDTRGGCMPCRQNNTECRTTDRVTQRATLRGHTELIEQDNNYLRQQVSDLQEQLRQNGIEPKQAPPAPARDPTIQPYAQSSANDYPVGYGQDGTPAKDGSLFTLPGIGAGPSSEDPHGHSAATSVHLSAVKANSLTLFGMKVELQDFVNINEEGPSKLSYESLLAPMTNRSMRSEYESRVRLPESFEEYSQYAHVYIDFLNPWLPILHRPEYMTLVSKYYHQTNFSPSKAETVVLQMSLALAKYQFSKRNQDTTRSNEAADHCHYAMTFVADLVTGNKIEDLQALVLICAVLRALPFPAPAYMISSWALHFAVDMNLHRSANEWLQGNSNRTKHQAEMRKRIFWSLLNIYVDVTGKLGRPMPLRLEDFDVEIPEVLEDELPSSSKPPNQRQCSFEIGIVMFRIYDIFIDVYNLLYAARHTGHYEENVRRLEARAATWRSELPSRFKLGTPASAEPPWRMFALWCDCWEAQLQMILHHPAICRSTAPETISRNLDICMKAASTIVNTNLILARMKSLDTTWQAATTYIAAIFLLLFCYWERRDTIKFDDVKKLEVDLSTSHEVLLEMGSPLGSGSRLKDTIKTIIDAGLGFIHRHHVEKTAFKAFANQPSKAIKNSSSPHERPTALSRGDSQAPPTSHSAHDTTGYHGFNAHGQQQQQQQQQQQAQHHHHHSQRQQQHQQQQQHNQHQHQTAQHDDAHVPISSVNPPSMPMMDPSALTGPSSSSHGHHNIPAAANQAAYLQNYSQPSPIPQYSAYSNSYSQSSTPTQAASHSFSPHNQQQQQQQYDYMYSTPAAQMRASVSGFNNPSPLSAVAATAQYGGPHAWQSWTDQLQRTNPITGTNGGPSAPQLYHSHSNGLMSPSNPGGGSVYGTFGGAAGGGGGAGGSASGNANGGLFFGNSADNTQAWPMAAGFFPDFRG